MALCGLCCPPGEPCGIFRCGACGLVGLRPLAPPFPAPPAPEVRLRAAPRLSPSLSTSSCLSPDAWSSSSLVPPIVRPPGTLRGAPGPPCMCGGACPGIGCCWGGGGGGMLWGALRPKGAPTGKEEGREPCGAFKQAWMRFLPSGWVTSG